MFPYVPKNILRKMGYLKDQEGIINRYLRENKNWETHLQKTNDFIIRAIQKHKGEQVVVLGSGWLLDFPVKEALQLSCSLLLVDICQPKQILNKYKGNEKICFMEGDITGGLVESIYYAIKNKRSVPEVISEISGKKIISPFPKSCLVISLNILNQLDILIVDYIKRKIEISETDIINIRKHIQDSHLDFLSDHNYCLITDSEEKIINSSTGETERINTIYTALPGGNVNSQWEWIFDTRHFYHRNAETVFLVRAIYQSCC